MRGIVALVVVGSVGLTLTACGDDGGEPSTCAAAQDVAASARALLEIDPLAAGTEGIEDAVDDLGASLDELAGTAGDQFAAPVDAVESALGDVGDTLASVGEEGIGATADALAAALTDLGAAWDELVAALETELADCDL